MAQLNPCCSSNNTPTPVYGSLYGEERFTPASTTPVNFTIAGPTSGMIANPVSNSITILSDGIYEITYSLNSRSSTNDNIVYSIVINGTPQTISAILFQYINVSRSVTPGSKTILFPLNATNQITVEVTGGSTSGHEYFNPSLVVKKIADS
ncbi:hypothetical protein [Metabacillus iocasae]|uniref:BclA C-terminal domain-containing protein n=1 Tax=Priestia iocasae TaxID=2291674 RepID=A0ABS2QWU2_9BACI|nr:hypothetical protein [Metabacillus iocasae]MBM7702949.1 hypothetical protein [Metabacillus iocasae]